MIARIVAGVVITLPLLGGWQSVGPFGGAAAVVQVDPHHPDTVLAATNNGLLFRSSDAGASWNSVRFPAQLHCVLHAFLVDPQHPDTYFAGVSGDTPEVSGLFETTDAGVSWTLLPGLAGKEVWSLAFWPGNSQTLAAGTHGGVFLSRDGGAGWKLISDSSNREMEVVVSLAFDPVDSLILFAGTPHLPWKTTNGGAGWFPVHTGMLDDSDVFSLNVDRNVPQRVFASACSGIYSSFNGGSSWAKLTGAPGASYRTYFVGLDPREAQTVFAGTTHGLVKSTNGGRTWNQVSTHMSRFVAFDPYHRGRIYVATDDDGIERSDDEGATLQAVNQGFCNRHLPMLTVAGGSLYTNAIYEDVSGGIYRITREHPDWEQIASPSHLMGTQVLSLVQDGTKPARFYAAGYNSLLSSGDAGKTWSALPGSFAKSRVVALLGPEPGSAFLLVATEGGLYRSGDSGKSWKRVELPGGPQRVLKFSRLEGNRIAAVTTLGLLFSYDGQQWDAAGPLPDHAQILEAVSSGDALIAASSTGLMRSEDAGQTWQLILKGLDRSTVRTICRHPREPGVLFAAQYSDVFESRDQGKSWTRISPAEPKVSIKELAILPDTADRLFVLTQRQGVFALPLGAFASGASNPKGPSAGVERGINEK
jgi:photosystem II stability/assembly factor-like uncharacterized protein